MANARITFYDLLTCAYFKRGNDAPLFGGASEVLANLKAWSDDLQLGATRIKGVEGKGCFLVEAKKLGKTNDWLLVLWNESHNHDNNIPSVHLNSTKGAPDIHSNGVVEGTVPGFATYFLFLPDRNKFATVKFDGDSSCIFNLKLYLQGFMRQFDPSAKFDSDSEHRTLLGHVDPNDPEQKVVKVRPRVQFRVRYRASDVQFIRANRDKIKSVVREEVLHAALAVERSRLSKVLSFVRGESTATGTVVDEVKTKVIVDYTPNEDELNSLINGFDPAMHEDGSDLGFKFPGEASFRWLGKGMASEVFELHDVEQVSGVVTMPSLTRALQRNRTAVLQLADG